MLYPLVFQPIFQERIWGGRSLERLYHKPLPEGVPIGESWEICDRPEAQSIIVNGPLAGRTLQWLMENHSRELLGRAKPLAGRFPLLIKILDAREKLSLQVHPPAAKARALGGHPKTELWYIADAAPNAELYVGLRPGITRQQFTEGIRAGTVDECFHRFNARAGDAMFLPSGRVHAIGAGLVIFEIQQNSDTTYRVFDWNRTDSSGRGRPLHVAESLECINFADFAPQPIRFQDAPLTRLVNDPLFSVEVAALREGEVLEQPLRSCRILAAIEGQVGIPHMEEPVVLAAGQFCLLPAVLGLMRVEASQPARVLISEPGT
jgi:mannose-6-phosphate isomerase